MRKPGTLRVGMGFQDRPSLNPSSKSYCLCELGQGISFFEPYFPHLQKKVSVPPLALFLEDVQKEVAVGRAWHNP